jgi:hypothetical protein
LYRQILQLGAMPGQDAVNLRERLGDHPLQTHALLGGHRLRQFAPRAIRHAHQPANPQCRQRFHLLQFAHASAALRGSRDTA